MGKKEEDEGEGEGKAIFETRDHEKRPKCFLISSWGEEEHGEGPAAGVMTPYTALSLFISIASNRQSL